VGEYFPRVKPQKCRNPIRSFIADATLRVSDMRGNRKEKKPPRLPLTGVSFETGGGGAAFRKRAPGPLAERQHTAAR